MNRLNLNWKLEWRDDRAKFANQYLDSITFTPTEDELNTIGNYILWGKDRKTGLNGRQEGLELETRAGTWDSKTPESLDALLESPVFNEASILSTNLAPPKIPKEIFSRKEAREKAPPSILHEFEALWREIDETEIITSFYDLSHNKRKTPIRPALLNRFTPEDLKVLEEKSTHLSPYSYLKKRHYLVELRRQQYTLKDSYSPISAIETEPFFEQSISPSFGTEIQVKPFGIFNDSLLDYKIFRKDRFPIPEDFTEEELKEISKRIWSQPAPSKNCYEFDFRNTEHLYGLFSIWEESQAAADKVEEGFSEETSVREFLRVAATYIELAKLEPMHREILEMKIKKKTNQEIALFINEKYKKNYKINYISTLYCKKCLEEIAEAAKQHQKVIENIFFEENFKKCKDCGGTFLLNEENFVKRHRSTDGFSPRCKRCEKILRDKKK